VGHTRLLAELARVANEEVAAKLCAERDAARVIETLVSAARR
jgi:hypothetical protein